MNDFVIPLGRTAPAVVAAVFASPAFQDAQSDPNTAVKAPESLTESDLEWVHETVTQGQKTSPAPSPAAERYLRTAFKQYDFDMPVSESQWRNFVLTKWYQQAQDPDPKVAKPALDSIAKSVAANLMVEKREISISTRSDEDLNKELKSLFTTLRAKANEKVIEGEATRA